MHVIGAAMNVHTALGPGLFERLYATCLEEELRYRGYAIASEIVLPVTWRGRVLPASYRLDMLVDDQLIVEVKAVNRLHPVHDEQLRTYLRLTGKPLGLLLNFNVASLRENGFRRVSPKR
jgi:GxxExxY protein